MKLNIDAISQKIQQFFTSEKIESTARETGFVKRNPKLTGSPFMQAIVFATLEKGKITLSSLAQNCLDVGISITEQGVDERINENCVEFLRNMSQEALERLRNMEMLTSEITTFFQHVLQFGFKQKRRKSPNSIQTISLISACYEWDIDSSSDDLLLA